MPIYEYVCRQCNHQFELLVRDGDKPACPSCGRRRLSKLLSVPAAHTAGSNQPSCPAPPPLHLPHRLRRNQYPDQNPRLVRPHLPQEGQS